MLNAPSRAGNIASSVASSVPRWAAGSAGNSAASRLPAISAARSASTAMLRCTPTSAPSPASENPNPIGTAGNVELPRISSENPSRLSGSWVVSRPSTSSPIRSRIVSWSAPAYWWRARSKRSAPPPWTSAASTARPAPVGGRSPSPSTCSTPRLGACAGSFNAHSRSVPTAGPSSDTATGPSRADSRAPTAAVRPLPRASSNGWNSRVSASTRTGPIERPTGTSPLSDSPFTLTPSSSPPLLDSRRPALQSSATPSPGSSFFSRPSPSPGASTSRAWSTSIVRPSERWAGVSAKSMPNRTAPSSSRLPVALPSRNAGSPGARIRSTDSLPVAPVSGVVVGASARPPGPSTNAGTSPLLVIASCHAPRVSVHATDPATVAIRPATPPACSADDATSPSPRRAAPSSDGSTTTSRGRVRRNSGVVSCGGAAGASGGSGASKWSPVSSPVASGGGGSSESMSRKQRSPSAATRSPTSGNSRSAASWASPACASWFGR